MFRRLSKLQDVVDWRLCIGCGACAVACTKNNIELVDLENEGIRPVSHNKCGECTRCLSLCPGAHVNVSSVIGNQEYQSKADHQFGPTLGIWEGYAADPTIRYRGSSGGVLTALPSVPFSVLSKKEWMV